jgi:hypothetical protein
MRLESYGPYGKRGQRRAPPRGDGDKRVVEVSQLLHSWGRNYRALMQALTEDKGADTAGTAQGLAPARAA